MTKAHARVTVLVLAWMAALLGTVGCGAWRSGERDSSLLQRETLRYGTYPTWSADARRAAVLGRGGDGYYVVLLDASTEKPKVVARRPIPGNEPPSIYSALDATGATLYYIVKRGAEPHILSMCLATGDVRDVVRGVDPTPSPAGRDVAYVYAASHDLAEGLALYLMHEDGRNERLTSQLFVERLVTWSPDSKWLTCLAKRIESPRYPAAPESLMLVSLDSTAPEQIEVGRGIGEAYWAVGWRNPNTLVFIASKADANRQSVWGVLSYDVRTGKRGEIVPFGRMHMSFSSVQVSHDATIGLWQVSDNDNRAFRVADLDTGDSAEVRFPEGVHSSLSPNGTSILAVGLDTGSVFYAHGRIPEKTWDVEKLLAGTAGGETRPRE